MAEECLEDVLHRALFGGEELGDLILQLFTLVVRAGLLVLGHEERDVVTGDPAETVAQLIGPVLEGDLVGQDDELGELRGVLQEAATLDLLDDPVEVPVVVAGGDEQLVEGGQWTFEGMVQFNQPEEGEVQVCDATLEQLELGPVRMTDRQQREGDLGPQLVVGAVGLGVVLGRPVVGEDRVTQRQVADQLETPALGVSQEGGLHGWRSGVAGSQGVVGAARRTAERADELGLGGWAAGSVVIRRGRSGGWAGVDWREVGQDLFHLDG